MPNLNNRFFLIAVVLLGSLLMSKVFGTSEGVSVGTQPLSLIMEDKINNGVVPTAVITMSGQIKNEMENTGEASLSTPEQSILQGLYPCVIGHPESWANSVGQKLLKNLNQRGLVLFTFVDELHQGLASHWDSIR